MSVANGGAVELAQLELLRRLTLSDEHVLHQLMCEQTAGRTPLDGRTSALVQLAGLVAIEADASSFQWAVDTALAAGADDSEITDLLLVIAPIVGLCRVSAAARTLVTDLGYQLRRR